MKHCHEEHLWTGSSEEWTWFQRYTFTSDVSFLRIKNKCLPQRKIVKFVVASWSTNFARKEWVLRVSGQYSHYIFPWITAQKMKFFIKDFFSKCEQIRSLLRIWSHLLKKSLMENFIFCVVNIPENFCFSIVFQEVYGRTIVWKLFTEH